MTDDSSYDVAQRIAWRLLEDADAEYRANPAAGTRDDIIARHMARGIHEAAELATEKVAAAAGAMGRRQA